MLYPGPISISDTNPSFGQRPRTPNWTLGRYVHQTMEASFIGQVVRHNGNRLKLVLVQALAEGQASTIYEWSRRAT